MPELIRGPSELDTRLAEIDRKLREIQVDLDPGREPAPSQATPDARDVSAEAPMQPSPHPPQAPPQGPPPPPDPPSPRTKGRSGPLASLLQRSSRRPPPPRAPASGADLGGVSPETHAKLLSAMRDLLDAYGWTLQQLPVAAEPVRPGEPPPVALSVGPFPDTAAVRGFEEALLRIPGVSEVVLRGYEGEDRAMFDVRISEPNA